MGKTSNHKTKDKTKQNKREHPTEDRDIDSQQTISKSHVTSDSIPIEQLKDDFQKEEKPQKKEKKQSKSSLKHSNHNTESQTNLESQNDENESHIVNNSDSTGIKRSLEDEDSDAEQNPRKKKKKKQPVSVDTSNKKGKKSIRQMKREKHVQRQEIAQAAAKDQLKSQCLSYLSQWKHDKSNWKFMKAKQVWLYKNKFSSTLLPDASWPLLLEYFESSKGNIRNMLLEDANKVIKQMDEWIESGKQDNSDEDNTEESTTTKPDETTYKRARDLIQCLQE